MYRTDGIVGLTWAQEMSKWMRARMAMIGMRRKNHCKPKMVQR
jgi:hypothetical protein